MRAISRCLSLGSTVLLILGRGKVSVGRVLGGAPDGRRLHGYALGAAALCLFGLTGIQASAFLVRDINPRLFIASSSPQDFVTVGGLTFFTAFGPFTGANCGLRMARRKALSW